MRIGFLGTGNMGGALALAIDRHSDNVEFILSDPLREKAEALGNRFRNAYRIAENKETVASSDYLFLAVKPQKLSEVLEPMKEAFQRACGLTVVSMVAAKEIATIRSIIDCSIPVIRIMPNTPISVDEGVIGYCPDGVSEEATETFVSLLSESALLVRTEEETLDAVSALSGSGPAFGYAFIRALRDGGVSAGLSADDALRMAARTMKGAAEMILTSDKTPETLIENVCSPGGSTIEGIKTLENESMEAAVRDAVAAAYRRTLEMK